MNYRRLNHYRQSAHLNAWMLVISMAALLAGVGFLLGGMPLALTAAAGVGLLYAVNPQVAPWLLLRSFRARPLVPESVPWLFQTVDALSARAGLRQRPALFLLPHARPAAFTTGQGAGAVIAVSQGLLQLLSPREVTGVLAHEISHIRHRDMRLMGFAQTLSQTTGALSAMGQLLLLVSLPLLLATGRGMNPIPLILLILAPTLSGLLHLALSRSREYAADMSAAELIGSPVPLADALTQLDRHNRGLWRRLPWTLANRREPAHWLSTHPPTQERIRRLMQTAPATRWPVSALGRFGRI